MTATELARAIAEYLQSAEISHHRRWELELIIQQLSGPENNNAHD